MTYRPLKICVLNLSGNVGKSTLAVHMLNSMRPKSKFISVESVNSSAATRIEGLSPEEIKASRFDDIYRHVLEFDDLIVDVGASNITDFMSGIARYKSAIREFDVFVVPTVPSIKQQEDTVSTIDWLHTLGIDPKKVRVLFNQYDGRESVDVLYSYVKGYALDDGAKKASWGNDAVVESNDVFEMVKRMGRTVMQAAGDPADYRAARVKAQESGDRAGINAAIDGQITRDLASSALDNLNAAYAKLLAPFEVPQTKEAVHV